MRLARIAYILRTRYLALIGRTTVGVRALVVDADLRVCLVRHTYMDGWHFPGGAVRRRESLREAAAREVYEEVGIRVTEEHPRLLGVYTNRREGRADHIVVTITHEWRQDDRPRTIEIADVQFFAPDGLPPDLSPGTRRRIEEWTGARTPTLDW